MAANTNCNEIYYIVRLYDSTLFLVTATHYIKQDLIATGLREITSCTVITVICVNAHDIIVRCQCNRCNSY